MTTDSTPELACAKELGAAYGLTARETEVLAGMLNGSKYADIARGLRIRLSTVTTHAKSVTGKLGIHGRGGLVPLLLRRKLRS